MFKLNATIAFEVTHRYYGQQDRGVRPKGANDQTSFLYAYALIGEPQIYQCLEIVYASEVVFSQDVMFTLAGAYYEEILLNQEIIKHKTVYRAEAGDTLRFKKPLKGFRIYLMATTQIDVDTIGKTGKQYPYYVINNPHTIRVTKGPEYEYLEDDFFHNYYKISTRSDISGLRLEEQLKAKQYDIITSCVTDGTIQLTKDGPIVLMRHRQTTGGYPRIFNVIEADMDRLAQYPHGALVKFELISIEDSIQLLLQYEEALRKMRLIT